MTTRKYSRKWLVLSAVATALLIIPRRSSRKSNNIPDKQDIKIDDADMDGSVESSDINDRRKSNEDSAIID